MESSDTEFAELMKRIRCGDKDAAEELHRRYRPTIQHAVRRRLHPRLRAKFDSADFVQDVWASFFADPAAHGAVQDHDHLARALATIARNKVIDATRQRLQSQKYNVNLEHSLNSSFLHGANHLAADQPTPSEVLMKNEEWEQFLQRQPPVYRRILELLRMGKQPKEIAAQLQLNIRTVYRLITRILQRTEAC
jgi:RNA polymerase sigma-70 factor (ECF subfamily)